MELELPKEKTESQQSYYWFSNNRVYDRKNDSCIRLDGIVVYSSSLKEALELCTKRLVGEIDMHTCLDGLCNTTVFAAPYICTRCCHGYLEQGNRRYIRFSLTKMTPDYTPDGRHVLLI